MRSVIDVIIRLLRQLLSARQRASSRPSTKRRSSKPARTSRSSTGRARPVPTRMAIEYSPSKDGDPDPGEVVWAWVPYEEDVTQGKDRPVAIIGRSGDDLVGVPLTSKRHDREQQVGVGTGPWDPQRRPSYAKVDQVLLVDADDVRREGAVLDRATFDAVVAGVQRSRRGTSSR